MLPFYSRFMIEYKRHVLSNGLTVLAHCDDTTPLVTVNMMYCVGARDESPERTGFAHLFEHLMFGGTRRFPDFDGVVDAIGGECNAFTNNDYTNYYLTVPAEYLQQALELEADRMTGNWDTEGDHWRVLDVQQRVVTEEYNQRYVNQPYGDVWMLLRPLCYQRHPYRWCTIGADIRHVQDATLDDVRQFYNRFYRPENAILAIAGGIDPDKALCLAEEAFDHIRRDTPADFPPVRLRPYPTEPTQQEPRTKMVNREVPANALYMAWHMCDRWNPHYYAFDMLSDLLANGHSSRLYSRLVRDSNLFSEINAYITGDLGPGLFVISGKLTDSNPDGIRQAQLAVTEQLDLLLHDLTTNPSGIAYEMEKAANKYENNFLLSQYKANDRALSLCYYEMIGNSELINNEPGIYRQVTPVDLTDSLQALSPDRCSTLGILINSK